MSAAAPGAALEAVAFLGDNVAPVAPEVLDAVVEANAGLAQPYGQDRWSAALPEAMGRALGREGPVATFAVGSGVAANAVALAALTRPGGHILCHPDAHARTSEHDAPAYQSGCTMVPVQGDGCGRLTPDGLERALAASPPPPGSAVTLTNLTEHGTLLTAAQTAELVAVAHAHGLPVHLDGARLAVAAAAVGGGDGAASTRALAELTWRTGIDALSFGATKNGGLDADAAVLFTPGPAERLVEVRDRAGHRPSKLRFLAAQLLAYLEGDGWVGRAAHANAMARRLADELDERDVRVVRPVDANHVFAQLSGAAARRVAAHGVQLHRWDRLGDGVVRVVTNWTTSDAQVAALAELLGADA